MDFFVFPAATFKILFVLVILRHSNREVVHFNVTANPTAQWTAQQVLAHFITIERSMQWLFKDILAGGPGSPEGFDVERFNSTQPKKLDGKTIDALIAQFKSVRNETISIVRSMSDADFDREGRHAFHGHGKLDRFITWAYEHVGLHLEDLRKRFQKK